jgi:hypothetical protein
MDCPVCGSSEREPLGRSRYRCTAPARLLTLTPPPSIGSNYGAVPINDGVPEPCGVTYTDTDELEERRISYMVLAV